MASSVISSRLNTILVRICDAAKKQERVHRSVEDALYDVISDASPDFALYERDLDNKILRSGDVVVGFRADTDASFTIVVKDKIRIPFTMKAGEFAQYRLVLVGADSDAIYSTVILYFFK